MAETSSFLFGVGNKVCFLITAIVLYFFPCFYEMKTDYGAKFSGSFSFYCKKNFRHLSFFIRNWWTISVYNAKKVLFNNAFLQNALNSAFFVWNEQKIFTIQSVIDFARTTKNVFHFSKGKQKRFNEEKEIERICTSIRKLRCIRTTFHTYIDLFANIYIWFHISLSFFVLFYYFSLESCVTKPEARIWFSSNRNQWKVCCFSLSGYHKNQEYDKNVFDKQRKRRPK